MAWDLDDEEIISLTTDSSGVPFSDENYPSEMQLRFELCVAHHLFAHYKMDELVWNHLSVRVSANADDYLITSFPFMFEDITPQNLSVSTGNFTGMVIHTAIYDKRPEVKAICHLHSPAVLAVSCLQEGMQFFSQESAGFYGKVSYHNWEGMSDDTSEQERLGNDLGPDAHTLIMRNHGAVTVGKSIGEAFVRMWYLEKACRTQLTVMQSGGAICRPPPDVLAHTAKQFDNIPNPAGYSEWHAIVKWFISRKFGIIEKTRSVISQTSPTRDVLDVKPLRATSSDLGIASRPVEVRGKKYLVGGTGSAGGALFPSFIPQGTTEFPLTFKFNTCDQVHATCGNESSIASLAFNIREIIETDLSTVGAVLFKKMPGVHSASDFSVLISALGYSTFDYSGGTSAREKKAAGVLTASSDPPAVSMEPHLEMAYNKEYPRKVFFFCRTAPLCGEGGETPVVDMRDFHLALPAAMVKKFREVGVRYTRRLPSATTSNGEIYNWQKLFFSENKFDVEKRCEELGYEYSWADDDALSWSYVRPAFVRHTPEGEECWFNQATCLHHTYYNDYPGGSVDRPDDPVLDGSMQPHNTCYGDGTPFSEEEVQFMRARLWERACAVTWSDGDLLVMDNTRVAHGRMSYTSNSKRSILVSLSGN